MIDPAPLPLASGIQPPNQQSGTPPAPFKLTPISEAVPQADVMIVDDEEVNIKLLRAMLKEENYHIRACRSGQEALESVGAKAPDIILLDIMMPGIDGFEVCRRLKQDPATQAIPVVMVTALHNNYHPLAIEVGADDFLKKPVNAQEIRMRVKSLLRLKSYHDKLAAKYTEIADKNAQLKALQQTKEGLLHMIIHDLNNPLTAIASTLQLMTLVESSIAKDDLTKLNSCLNNCFHLQEMIRGLLDVHQLEEQAVPLTIEAADLTRLIQKTLEGLQAFIEQSGVHLELQLPQVMPVIYLDHHLIQRVLANLVTNALRHTPKGGTVTLTVEHGAQQNHLTICVHDTGAGIEEAYQEEIFEKFKQVSDLKSGSTRKGYGLGLAFCKLAVEAHQGRIWVRSAGREQGATFGFELPLADPSSSGLE